jgi:ABC-2 type transport system permease protein
MAVYKRGYEGYTGRLTPEWTRFLVIARNAYRNLFDSKLLILYFVLCFVYPVVCAALIYVPHNAAVVKAFGKSAIAINGYFFLKFVEWQCSLAFLLAAFIGPGLVSRDLANNSLPLYFSRPFTRTEYVAGKMSVLAILMSAVTWVPGVLLFGFQSHLEGAGWGWANLWIAGGIFAGCWIWIAAMCLMVLAISAWVKWRLAAGALMLGIFFVAAGFGEAMNNILHTQAGNLINIGRVVGTIWAGLFRQPQRWGLTQQSAWLAIAAGCGLCLYLLSRKLRPYEVERS